MLTPDKFAESSAYELIKAAAEGHVGMDQRWVRAILEKGDAAVTDIVRFGSEDQEVYPIPVDEEICLILRQLESPAALPFFLDYLRENGSDIPDILLEAIYRIRDVALEPLIQLYGEMEEDEAAEVAFILASFRKHDERVLQILKERLEYDVSEGAICLGLYGDPAARPVLEKMMAEVGDDEHLRHQIEEAIEDLSRERTEDEAAVFDVYSYFPEKSGPETAMIEESDLIEMLGSEDPEYRFAAAAGFIGRDYEMGASKKLLKLAQSDPDPTVRAKAWEALGSEVGDDDKIFEAMLARLRDTTAPKIERAGALAGLGQRADEPEIRPFAEQFYEDPETRAAALSAMWNSLERTYAPYFPPHLDDEDIDIKKQAISGVGYLGIADSAEKLREFFHGDLRANALFAYALSARSEVSPSRMRSLQRRIDELAGGLTEDENELVEMALDERLLLHGHKPVFNPEHEHEEASEPAKPAKVGRNDPCPCGSGKKYKKCCGG